MNILVSVNDNYIYPLLVMLESLYKTNTWEKIEVYLLYSNLSKKHISMLNKITKKNKNNLTPIMVKEEIEKLPTREFSTETYFRLFAFKYLPQHLHKILFLDPDMIICKSLENIYKKDISDFYFCAVPDIEDDQIIKTKKLFSINNSYKYVNSGFLLMNLQELRKNADSKDLSRFIIKNSPKLPYLDQDVLNILFASKILYVDNNFNYDCRYSSNSISEKINFILSEYILRRKSKKYVLHYKGRSKPWNKGYIGKFQNQFFKYAKLMKKELKN